MVQLQIIFQVNPGVESGIEINILEREDATPMEREMAQAVQDLIDHRITRAAEKSGINLSRVDVTPATSH